PRVIDLNRVARESVQMLRRLLGEDVEIVMALAAAHPRAKADPAQITQVILNLAINARDAMPNGGKLTIPTADLLAAPHPPPAPAPTWFREAPPPSRSATRGRGSPPS